MSPRNSLFRKLHLRGERGKISAIPAIHALDGSVSFILEWNGLKFCFSSDTSPAQFGKVMSIIKPRMAEGYHFFNYF